MYRGHVKVLSCFVQLKLRCLAKFEQRVSFIQEWRELRLSSWASQTGVIQAISTILFQLGQNEGYSKQPIKTEWVDFWIIPEVFRPPFSPLHGFGVKILKIELRLGSKSEYLLTIEYKQFYYHFSWRKTGPLPAHHNSFLIGAKTHPCHERFC